MAQVMVSSSFRGAGGAHDVQPMSEINTTPLIDVMLVLLIMFIITVPMQSHQVQMDLPNGPPPDVTIHRVKNDLQLSANGLLKWNGRVISDSELASTLGWVASYADQPEIHFRPDATARYERVDQVLGIAARSGATRFGFAGNEQYSQVF